MIGKELVELMGERRFEIAKEVGLSRGIIYKWQYGERNPSLPSIVAVVEAMNMQLQITVIEGVHRVHKLL